MKVGNIDIVPIIDGAATVPLEMAVRNRRGSAWDCADQPTDAEGRLQLGIGSYLIRTGDRTVLVDLGMGPDLIHEAFATGSLLAELRTAGVEPDTVTDVVFTHLHIDHVGWSSVLGAVTFPRATYHVHAADWAYFMTGDPVDPVLDPIVRGMLAPIEGRLQTFDAEIDLAPGIHGRPAPGHTPGSTVFVISDRGERALLLGDVVHAVAELTDVEWESTVDVDTMAANAMRARLAAELEASGDPFAPAHFPGLAFGRLVTADAVRRFRWVSERGL